MRNKRAKRLDRPGSIRQNAWVGRVHRVIRLSPSAEVRIRFDTERGKLDRYAVTLIGLHEGSWHTVRLYDNAHGRNEMHRYNRLTGKQAPESFYSGPADKAMGYAEYHLRANYEQIIDSWLRH